MKYWRKLTEELAQYLKCPFCDNYDFNEFDVFHYSDTSLHCSRCGYIVKFKTKEFKDQYTLEQ